MFELAPVSLWVEDFSALHQLFTQWRAEGVSDLRAWLHEQPARVAECSARIKVLHPAFLRVHPEFIDRCMQEIRVLDVNHQTLSRAGASDKPHLLRNLPHVFRDDMRVHFADPLIDLWNGKPTRQREVRPPPQEKSRTRRLFSVAEAIRAC